MWWQQNILWRPIRVREVHRHLSAEDSDFNDSTEQMSKFTLKMDDLAGGNRRVGMRVKDNQGNWSNINYLMYLSWIWPL